MVGPNRAGRLLPLLLAAALSAACPPKQAPETVARAADEEPGPVEKEVAPPPPPVEAPAAEAAEEVPAKSPVSDAVIVIDPGDPSSATAPSLVEAARQEKERRVHAGKPVAVINDKNLSSYAKGQITFAGPKQRDDGFDDAKDSAAREDEAEREQFWRSKVLAVRIGLREATAEVKELEKEAADLRRRFYGEDDPFVRDGRIKPEWDRTLDRLRLARERVAEARHELDEVLEEGRRAGALPGWLREGAEQEPAPEKPPPTVEPAEPQTLQEGQRHG